MESNAFQPLLNIDMNWFYLWSLNEKHLKWEISSSRSIKQELFKKLHICIFFIWKSFVSQGSTFCQRLSWLYIWFCFYVYGFTLLHLCIFLAWIFNLKLRRLLNLMLMMICFLLFRFRSITKQYFRRADGVVVMFDLTSEASFLNVKQWMVSIEV